MDPHGDLLRDLVHQFSDPFAFYRELIQNSIDAGSARIEVRLRFTPGAATGTATAVVQDWGEGMNRQVIDQYLLTKFRSSKENDLTKIGKFGIGFLSVFAPAPDAVVVETGKDGESWRLLFKPDLTWELLESPEPYEGTTVTLHKSLGASGYLDFAARSERSVRAWCRHSEADVAFAAGAPDGGPPPEPALVREPLAVQSPFQVEYREEGTHIVAGPSPGSPPKVGLYNRGLTLMELEEDLVPGVTFKILSRYLEHTLTRDNVRRDRHFERAIALVKRLSETALLERLRKELKLAAGDPARADEHRTMLSYAAPRLRPEELWFRSVRGAAVHGDAVLQTAARAGGVLCALEPSPLTEVLEAGGGAVLLGDPDDPAVQIAARACDPIGRAVLASHRYAMARADTRPEAQALARAAGELLRVAGAKVGAVMVGKAFAPGPADTALRLEGPDVPTPLEATRGSPFKAGPAGTLCLNTEEPSVAAAVAVAARAPDLAALLLVRRLAVAAGALTEKLDHKLTERVLSRAFRPHAPA
ncbi:MAG TPA: ATP-binding protein [Myxococcaceae bacterium]|nr:ATP-binding protein [Myxococcaceae bacterium]